MSEVIERLPTDSGGSSGAAESNGDQCTARMFESETGKPEWIELAKIARQNFYNRRALEWKLAFGFWTAIGLFTAAFLSGRPIQPPPLLGLIYLGIFMASVGLWLLPIQLGHAGDHKWWIFYMRRARGDAEATLPAPLTSIRDMTRVAWLWFFGQIAVTAFFLSLSYSILIQLPIRSQQPIGDALNAAKAAESSVSASGTNSDWELTLTAANVLVAFASLITAFLVPFASIWVSQRLVTNEAMRRDARDVLLKLNQDVQSFRIAILNSHPQSQIAAYELPKAVDRANYAKQAIQDQITVLNGDCLALGLLFGKTADGLGMKVRHMISSAEACMTRKPTPPLDEVDAHFQRAIKEVAEEMKPLWSHIQGLGLLRRSRNHGNDPVRTSGNAA